MQSIPDARGRPLLLIAHPGHELRLCPRNRVVPERGEPTITGIAACAPPALTPAPADLRQRVTIGA